MNGTKSEIQVPFDISPNTNDIADGAYLIPRGTIL